VSFPKEEAVPAAALRLLLRVLADMSQANAVTAEAQEIGMSN
jgi:hypothetical protein